MADKEMIDDYVDCAGEPRRFRLTLDAEGRFLDAIELRDGEPQGLRFVLPVKFGEMPPWGEMRMRIRERLATRHIVHDQGGRLQLLTEVVHEPSALSPPPARSRR